MKKINLLILSLCLTCTGFAKEKNESRAPAANTISDQVDEFVREVDALEGKAGEDLAKNLAKDNKKLEAFADKVIEKVLFFNQKENKDKLDRPEDFAVCLYHLTKNPSFSKSLRDVVQGKVLLHPKKKVLEKLILEGEQATKGNA